MKTIRQHAEACEAIINEQDQDRMQDNYTDVRSRADIIEVAITDAINERLIRVLKPVLQDWVCNLTYMQQSVLITACRGPDGLKKDHISKVLCRWLRRCFMISAFDKKVLVTPYELTGGSFTGPCIFPSEEAPSIDAALSEYLRHVDETPHHFHLHLMHAAEILGYKHPNMATRRWWHTAYRKIVSDAHLHIETEEQMDKRLGDNRTDWLAAEEVTAK